MINKDICSIIVTYNSKIERLSSILSKVSLTTHVIICDNSTDEHAVSSIVKLASDTGADYLRMDGNVGISKAQNIGIERSFEHGANYLFLLDDDSIPQDNLPLNLMQSYVTLLSGGFNPGAVCARAVNFDGIDIGNIKSIKGKFSKCINMMSSGSLIPVSVIHDVGFMDEALFIDCVDFDWGWRAINKGYELAQANDLFIEHNLGDVYFKFGFIQFGIAAPIRHYYQYRNILKMIFRPYVPALWKFKQILVLLLKLIFIPIIVKPRISRFNYMLQGIKDWAKHVGGKYPLELK